MIAPSLYADLMSRGVELSVDAGSRLRVQAHAGVLDESLRAALSLHRDELLQLIFEIEERAAIMFEIDDPTPEQLEETKDAARRFVTGGMATPDGQLWLDEYAMNHPTVRDYFEVFGSLAGQIEVRRATDEEKRAA